MKQSNHVHFNKDTEQASSIIFSDSSDESMTQGSAPVDPEKKDNMVIDINDPFLMQGLVDLARGNSNLSVNDSLNPQQRHILSIVGNMWNLKDHVELKSNQDEESNIGFNQDTGLTKRKSEKGGFDSVKRQSIRDDSVKKREFLVKLARAMVLYGAPTYRIEYQVDQVSRVLGLETAIFVFPGFTMLSFCEDQVKSTTHLIKISQGYDMEKLALTNDLCNDLSDRKIGLDDAIKEFEKIRTQKRPRGFILGNRIVASKWFNLINIPVNAWAIGVVAFNLENFEGAMAGVLSIFVALLLILAEDNPGIIFILDFLSAFLVSFFARTMQWMFSDESHLNIQYGNGNCFHYVNVCLTALVMLLPGLSLTWSMTEVATKNMVSGTVRMFGAFFTALMLGFGMAVGASLVLWSDLPALGNHNRPDTCPPGPGNMWIAIAFPFAAVTSNFFFRARLKQYPIMSLTIAAGFGVQKVLSDHLSAGSELPIVIASLAVGLLSNIYARVTRDISMGAILSGVLLLVPGAIGVKSSFGFLDKNVVDGTAFAFQMLVIALCITVGLFLSSLIVWPTRRRR